MRGFELKFVAFVVGIVFSSMAFTQTEGVTAVSTTSSAEVPDTAHATVELVSEQLIAMLGDAKQRYKQDPEGFYADIESVISPWLDFARWSQSVMGSEYASRATEEQLAAFEIVFKKSLVETYAKGLINVEDSGFKIEPPRPGDEDKTRVAVAQTLYSGSDTVKVIYAMWKAEDGKWQFTNVNLEGITLRQTFQGQFKSAALDNDGDLDKVIEGWGA